MGLGISFDFQPALAVNCSHAAGSGGGNGLTVALVLYVAGDKNAFDVSLGAIDGLM